MTDILQFLSIPKSLARGNTAFGRDFSEICSVIVVWWEGSRDRHREQSIGTRTSPTQSLREVKR